MYFQHYLKIDVVETKNEKFICYDMHEHVWWIILYSLLFIRKYLSYSFGWIVLPIWLKENKQAIKKQQQKQTRHNIFKVKIAYNGMKVYKIKTPTLPILHG